MKNMGRNVQENNAPGPNSGAGMFCGHPFHKPFVNMFRDLIP